VGIALPALNPVTAHPSVDYGSVVAAAPLTIDFRGVTREIESPRLVRP